ncbi:hypothetical protein EYC84_007631 [Monilinia fructicola]|uniref:Uncharacterized protein n=1 Tax=Monilinia fructicola TaxID=38448 RepID=A0A5M9JIR7_MONFR|nr:hypothetical protein EYC84_007631 [Monilinia fructicola]
MQCTLSPTDFHFSYPSLIYHNTTQPYAMQIHFPCIRKQVISYSHAAQQMISHHTSFPRGNDAHPCTSSRTSLSTIIKPPSHL